MSRLSCARGRPVGAVPLEFFIAPERFLTRLDLGHQTLRILPFLNVAFKFLIVPGGVVGNLAFLRFLELRQCLLPFLLQQDELVLLFARLPPFKLEGLAGAISWGFESPLPHHRQTSFQIDVEP